MKQPYFGFCAGSAERRAATCDLSAWICETIRPCDRADSLD